MSVAAAPTLPPTPSPAPGPSPTPAASTDATAPASTSDAAGEHHGPPWGLIALGGMLVAGVGFLVADSPGMPKRAGLVAGGIAGLAAAGGLLYAGVNKLSGPADSPFGQTDGAIGKYAVGPMAIAGGIGSGAAGVYQLSKAIRA
jgi:hypothetical protein